MERHPSTAEVAAQGPSFPGGFCPPESAEASLGARAEAWSRLLG